MSDVAIRVEGLSKQYRIGEAQGRYQTFREAILRTASAPVRWAKGERPDPSTIWALDDVSFEVKQGEVIGVIGRNGAGKSTLLKILSRITKPTRGRVELNGRVGSLLEVGTGFHPELTGRENVFLNGAILGMTRREIQRKFDEIVDFSGVEKFIDTPVKRYSSGMQVRLAFSVAAHLEPEILLVDEVLAVGDAEFQKKSLGKMDEVSKTGRTVLFVSHNMGAVTQLCKSAILLDVGKIVEKGTASDVVQTYLTNVNAQNTSIDLSNRTEREGNGAARFIKVTTKNAQGNETNQFVIGDSLRVQFAIRTFAIIDTIRIAIGVRDSVGLPIFLAADVDGNFQFDSPKGLEVVEMEIPDLRLYPGTYYLMLWMANAGYDTFDKVEDVLQFDVIQGGDLVMRKLPRNQAVIFTTPKWKRLAITDLDK